MIPFEIAETVWDKLKRETRPIFLYGMGNGADKIRAVCAQKEIAVTGVFASDDFVRGQAYAGYPVKRLDEITQAYGEDIVILIAFASQRPEILARMRELDKRFDTYAPDVPVAGEGLFDLDYVRAHEAQLAQAYDLLADEPSRAVFRHTIAFKLTGRISHLDACTTPKEEAFQTILKPSKAEHFADLGAYNGDTIRELLSFTGGAYAGITALEPDPKNYRKLTQYIEGSLSGSVCAVHAGAWEEDAVAHFAARAGRHSALALAGRETVMRALDSVLEGAPCTLLKMDVEGAEAQALRGARQTIARHRPGPNIAAYHRNEDLFALPLQVHAICPDYQLYLRHHPYVPAWDTNLYACTR